MKTPRKQQRSINSIPTGRWTAYAAAAAASTFAAVHSAEATIHYSGRIDSKIKGNGTGTFSLGSGAGSFVIRHYWGPYGSTSRDGNVTFQLYAGSPSVNGTYAGFDIASVGNLDRGDTISLKPFVPNGGIMAGNSCGCSKGIRGKFRGPGVGFVGFKFNNGGW